MMRYFRYLVLGVIALGLVVVSLANRQDVTLTLLPQELGNLLGFNLTQDVPLFVVLFGGIVVGVLIGFVWEWVREHKHRAEVVRKTRELSKLERELANMQSSKADPVNDVIALIDAPRKAG
jgi:uncharacterized integral membrane protein